MPSAIPRAAESTCGCARAQPRAPRRRPPRLPWVGPQPPRRAPQPQPLLHRRPTPQREPRRAPGAAPRRRGRCRPCLSPSPAQPIPRPRYKTARIHRPPPATRAAAHKLDRGGGGGLRVRAHRVNRERAPGFFRKVCKRAGGSTGVDGRRRRQRGPDIHKRVCCGLAWPHHPRRHDLPG